MKTQPPMSYDYEGNIEGGYVGVILSYPVLGRLTKNAKFFVLSVKDLNGGKISLNK